MAVIQNTVHSRRGEGFNCNLSLHKFVYHAVVASMAHAQVNREDEDSSKYNYFIVSRATALKLAVTKLRMAVSDSKETESRTQTLAQCLGMGSGAPSISSYHHPRCGTAQRTPRTLPYIHRLLLMAYVRFEKETSFHLSWSSLTVW